MCIKKTASNVFYESAKDAKIAKERASEKERARKINKKTVKFKF